MISTKFIKATQDFATYEKPVNAPYIRKSFTLEALPEKAVATLTSTGFYRFWVNGTELTASRLAPCITNPDDIIFYDTYDVAKYLKEGENCFAFLLGNGMSNSIGGFIWDFDKALFRSAPKLAFAFEAETGEQKMSFEADESFKCAPSPIYFDDLRSGEFYDATKEKDGWNLPGFDDSDWCAALSAEPARGKTCYNDTDKIVVTKELKPVKIYEGYHMPLQNPASIRPDVWKISEKTFYKPESEEKGFVFEFSENTACVPKLKIKGKKGQKIILQASEYCDPDGGVCFDNIQMFYPFGFCQRDIYICKGEGVEEYIPSFTYHGARYFFVIGAEKEQITDETVTMLVQTSDIAERGNFSCSDRIANLLQRNARTSDLANFVYFPTDCPHREKNGWTGDAGMSAEHMIQNLAVEHSWKQWLKMICAAQREDGAIPGIIPTTGWGYAWGNGPVWDQVLVELPYQAYIYRGNKELFELCSTAVMRYLNYIAKRRSPDGSICIGLGDWCHAMRGGGSNHLCPTEVSDTITCVNICRKAKFLFDVCGMKVQSVFAEALGNEFLAAVRDRMIDYDTMTVRGSCQTAQAMGLYYDIFEKGEKPEAYRRLLEFVHEADDHFNCGMIGVRVLFRTLAAHGDAELAYKLITRTDAPSYGIWADKFGLVSNAESFNATVNGYGTSLNHHFMSDYSGFFISHIAGLQVNPYKDNPAYIRINPSFIPALDNASAFYETVAGKVSVFWVRKGEEIELTVEKADGVGGEVVLPNGYIFTKRSDRPDYETADRRISPLAGVVYTIRKKA